MALSRVYRLLWCIWAVVPKSGQLGGKMSWRLDLIGEMKEDLERMKKDYDKLPEMDIEDKLFYGTRLLDLKIQIYKLEVKEDKWKYIKVITGLT